MVIDWWTTFYTDTYFVLANKISFHFCDLLSASFAPSSTFDECKSYTLMCRWKNDLMGKPEFQTQNLVTPTPTCKICRHFDKKLEKFQTLWQKNTSKHDFSFLGYVLFSFERFQKCNKNKNDIFSPGHQLVSPMYIDSLKIDVATIDKCCFNFTITDQYYNMSKTCLQDFQLRRMISRFPWPKHSNLSAPWQVATCWSHVIQTFSIIYHSCGK